MSVINKVLRDLDQRAAGADPAAADPAASQALTHGTASVHAVAALPRRRAARRGPLLVIAAVALLTGVWWVWSVVGGFAMLRTDRAAALPQTGSVAHAPTVLIAQASTAPGPIALPAAAASSSVASPVLSVIAVPAGQPAAASVSSALVLPPLLAAAPPVIVAAAPAQAPALAQAQAQAPPPAAARSEPASAEAASAPASWTEAAMEALAQTQRLWNAGAREPALQLLRDALAGVERAHAADLVPGGAGAAVGLAMVRDLVRIESLQGQHGAVLALLKRHERLWAGQADLWAVRASAAQRLAQHAESGQAYLMALKIRPGEPRWMLGAAVAMAAQGQLVPAGEMAEQARVLGAVNPEVLAYLRQLGVTLRER